MWEIFPFEGVGPLRFGMSLDDVKELLGEPSLVGQ
jgi:outer membrane protein assembly factor BamE (lipoprotein component of BamABCDE complex)